MKKHNCFVLTTIALVSFLSLISPACNGGLIATLQNDTGDLPCLPPKTTISIPWNFSNYLDKSTVELLEDHGFTIDYTGFGTSYTGGIIPNPWNMSEWTIQIVPDYGLPHSTDIAAGIPMESYLLFGESSSSLVMWDYGSFLGIWSYDGNYDYFWDTEFLDLYRTLFEELLNNMFPEPASILLLGLGAVFLRKRKHITNPI